MTAVSRWRILANGRTERAELSHGYEDSAGYLSAFVQALRQVLCGGRPKREELSDCAGLFSAFLSALRSARVDYVSLQGIDFTPALASLVLEAPIITDELNVPTCNFTQLTDAQFRALIFHFSPRYLFLGTCPTDSPRLRASQISDDFLRALIKNRVRHVELPTSVPVDGGSFSVTDDAIVDFFMRPDDDDKDEDSAFLSVSHGSFSKDLFKSLVQAGAVCKRTQPVTIYVQPVRYEDEDLRDFAQHLSYRGRQKRIYAFPGKQQGEGAPMDLQIALKKSPLSTAYELIMARAPRHGPYFESSDE